MVCGEGNGGTYISGSLLMSAMAAIGMPKLDTGPQKSVHTYISLHIQNIQIPIDHILHNQVSITIPPSHPHSTSAQSPIAQSQWLQPSNRLASQQLLLFPSLSFLYFC